MYYTYIYLDTRKPGNYCYEGLSMSFLFEPIYVGKGKGPRIRTHLSPHSLKTKSFKNHKFKSILSKGFTPVALKYISNVTENEAFIAEITLINVIGRADLGKGTLTNQTDGGGGATNSILLSARKKVDKICPKTKMVLETFDSITIAGLATNISITSISGCCTLRARTASGYMWKFHDAELVLINNQKKRVSKFDLSYNPIQIFESVSEAAVDVNTNIVGIMNCCKGKTGECAGYIWEYTDINEEDRLRYRTMRAARNPNTEKGIRRVCKLTGAVKDYKSMGEAGADNGVSISMVNMIAKGKRGRTLGYTLYYSDDRSYDDVIATTNAAAPGHCKPVVQMGTDGSIIREWLSPKHAHDGLGINHSRICNAARNGKATAGGFRWSYK